MYEITNLSPVLSPTLTPQKLRPVPWLQSLQWRAQRRALSWLPGSGKWVGGSSRSRRGTTRLTTTKTKQNRDGTGRVRGVLYWRWRSCGAAATRNNNNWCCRDGEWYSCRTVGAWEILLSVVPYHAIIMSLSTIINSSGRQQRQIIVSVVVVATIIISIIMDSNNIMCNQINAWTCHKHCNCNCNSNRSAVKALTRSLQQRQQGQRKLFAISCWAPP